VGHGGSTSAQDGNIHYDTEKLTSAKRLIEKILVRIKRDAASDAKEVSDPPDSTGQSASNDSRSNPR